MLEPRGADAGGGKQDSEPLTPHFKRGSSEAMQRENIADSDVRPESGLKVIGRREDKKLWLGNVKGFTVAFTDN